MNPRFRKILLFGVAPFILFIILTTEPIHRDESILSVTLAEDEPLWLLDDEHCMEIYRAIGYNITTGFQTKFWNVFFQTVDLNDKYAYLYQLGELERFARLNTTVFQAKFDQGMLQMLFSNPENMEKLIELWKFRWGFFRKLRSGRPLKKSDEIKLMEHLKRIERYHFEKWCFMDFEIIADYYFATQKDSTAFEYLKRAYKSTIETEHCPICSHLAGRIGVYLSREGKFREAEKFYDSSLEFALKANDPYYISRALSFTSFLKASLGEFAVADSLMRKALDFCGMTRDPICEISKLVGLARLYNSFGETEKALYYLERAILIAMEKLKMSRVRENKYLYEAICHYLATAYSLKGKINLKMGKIEDAVASIEHALDIYRNSLDRYSESKMLKLLADAYAASGEYGRAEKTYSKAISIVTKLKKKRRLSEYLTSMASFQLKRGKLNKSKALLKEAGEIASKENYWMQDIDIGHVLSKIFITEGDTARAVRELERSIWIYAHNLEKLKGAGDKRAQAEKVNELFMNLFDLIYRDPNPTDSLLFWKVKQYFLINSPGVRYQTASYPRYVKNDPLAVLKDRAVLCYIRGFESYYLIDISDEGTSCRRLEGSRKRIEELAAAISNAYTSPPSSTEDTKVENPGGTATRALYRILLGGVQDLLRKKTHVTVIPDGGLFSVPFELLLAQKELQGKGNSVPSVTYLPSICFIDGKPDKTAGSNHFETALIVVNPHVAGWVHQRYPFILPLKKADEEAVYLIEHTEQPVTLKGERAIKDSILALMENAQVIHFATHTVYHPEYEGEPSLLLASDETPVDMGRITLGPEEIKRMKLNAQLVVLATCESSSEKKRLFKQKLGLAEAFLVAGAERVIAVRNTVKDSDTALFFGEFYKNLLERGMKLEDAFHHTRNSLFEEKSKDEGVEKSLARWSSFILLAPVNTGE